MAKKKLTPKQALFVREYLVDLNATQAALRAGYSKKTAAKIGSENLQKPAIKDALDKAMKKRAKTVEITAEKVLRDLEECREAARADKQYAPAIRASELQGRHLKMFVDRIEAKVAHSHEDALNHLDDDEPG